ncbi:unnamed protein product, partial [Oikopleura dioica]
MDKIFENQQPVKSAVEKFETNHGSLNAKDPKHEGMICDYFDQVLTELENDYNCEDYSEDYGDIQYYLDINAEYFGCGLELCEDRSLSVETMLSHLCDKNQLRVFVRVHSNES